MQQLIDAGRDLYVRGTESRSGVGVAFITHRRRLSAVSCRGPAVSHTAARHLLNVTRWSSAGGDHVTGSGSKARHVISKSVSVQVTCVVVVIVAAFYNFDVDIRHTAATLRA